jgi:multicomponent Na+:H+ antiporter subunit D
VTVLAHGLAKGALFLACGVVLLALDDVDELRLHGKGRRLPWVGAAWLVAVVALASPPFLGIWSGHALIEDAAYKLHDDWVAPILAISTILATGAIARAGGRVFLGLGPADDPLLSDNPPETPASRDDPSLGLMTAITLALALGGLAVGALTGVATTLEDAAHGFVNHKAYVDAVLHHVPHTPEENSAWVTTTSSVVWGVVTLLGTFASAAFGLYRARLPEWTTAGLTALARPFRAVHSGHVGDYVAWLICGAAAVGGVFALTIR